MIIDWQGQYQNSEYYSAGLYGNNGIIGYSAPTAATILIIMLSDGRLAMKVTDVFYLVL